MPSSQTTSVLSGSPPECFVMTVKASRHLNGQGHPCSSVMAGCPEPQGQGQGYDNIAYNVVRRTDLEGRLRLELANNSRGWRNRMCPERLHPLSF